VAAGTRRAMALVVVSMMAPGTSYGKSMSLQFMWVREKTNTQLLCL
jgi:hypothetical protein